MSLNCEECEWSRRLKAIGITYGNLEGQYFTQWRIDTLNELIYHVVYLFADTPTVQIF